MDIKARLEKLYCPPVACCSKGHGSFCCARRFNMDHSAYMQILFSLRKLQPPASFVIKLSLLCYLVLWKGDGTLKKEERRLLYFFLVDCLFWKLFGFLAVSQEISIHHQTHKMEHLPNPLDVSKSNQITFIYIAQYYKQHNLYNRTTFTILRPSIQKTMCWKANLTVNCWMYVISRLDEMAF